MKPSRKITGWIAVIITAAISVSWTSHSALAHKLTSVSRLPALQAAAPPAPNTDPVYRELREIIPDGQPVTVSNLVLKRDAGTFTFKSGTFFFLKPVQGKITGAVFSGSATFSLDPPLPMERRSLELLTKTPEMVEEFSTAVLRFTDGSEAEIEGKGSVSTAPVESSASLTLNDIRTALRKNLHYNLDTRLLQDVLSSEPGGFFAAFIKGNKYSSKEIYIIDPHGVPADLAGAIIAPEEVAFTTYEEKKSGIWAAFHYSDEYSDGRASGRQTNNLIRVPHQTLDVSIDRSGFLNGETTTTVQAFAKGVRVLPFNLFSKLRVKSVTDENHQPLAFIQEKKDEDPQFVVILPEAPQPLKRFTINVSYAGPEAVFNEGGGNFYPAERTSWFPASYSTGNYSTYDATFRIPKGLKMVFPGTKVSETVEGDRAVSLWKDDVPIPEAGFSFGNFKEENAQLLDNALTVEAYANLDPTDFTTGLQTWANTMRMQGYRVTGVDSIGTMNTTSMLKKALGEEQLAIPLYTDFFGPLPYKRIAVAQQTAPNYGQSFAGIVFLPITSFLDSTTRQRLGFHDPLFFEVVGPHELAHQWWGNTVGWVSYRDQWMSEGFAEFSASLFLQTFYKEGEYDRFWEKENTLLTEKDKEGFRAIDVGPVALGYRLASTRVGFSIPRRLIYPKGGFILNMVRMMMWSNETGDQNFKELMRDFVRSYTNRPATTEDFKFALEQHMIPSMNLTGDSKMDWFFNEYVYGTALPNEKFTSSFSNSPDGTVVLNFAIEQSNVTESFRMPIPIYIELANGQVARVGSAPLVGNTRFENQIVLRGISQKPKRAMINYFHDVLCAQ